jgi:hypothetical protein
MRGEEVDSYVTFVRTLSCVSCGKDGPSEFSHVATGAGQKGVGLKVPTSQGVPQCNRCHAEFEGRVRPGKFDHLDRDQKRELAARWVDATRLAAIPEDFDQALQFAEMGLGRIAHDEQGHWNWTPIYEPPTKEPTT